MRVDLVMWTRDGAATLPAVLTRLNKVFAGVGGQRIIVDDYSRDGSVEICEKHGWAVYKNKGKGISDGANTALGLVETRFFCSFEQDLLLCADWPEKCLHNILKTGVAAVSGVRLANKSGLRGLDEYAVRHSTYFGRTLDNTVYDTEVLRGLGGFPDVYGACTDSFLFCRFERAGLFWFVCRDAVSTHLKSGLLCDLRSQFWYGKSISKVKVGLPSRYGLTRDFGRVCFSPIRGCLVAFETGDLQAGLYYPFRRCASFLGRLSGCV